MARKRRPDAGPFARSIVGQVREARERAERMIQEARQKGMPAELVPEAGFTPEHPVRRLLGDAAAAELHAKVYPPRSIAAQAKRELVAQLSNEGLLCQAIADRVGCSYSYVVMLRAALRREGRISTTHR